MLGGIGPHFDVKYARVAQKEQSELDFGLWHMDLVIYFEARTRRSTGTLNFELPAQNYV